jgi:DNA-binding beta-propeller fold protein YncE
MNAPPLTNTAQATVSAFFPDGHFLIVPDAYSYQPTVLTANGNAAPESGGTTLTLTGYGFDDFPSTDISVTVSGNPAPSIGTITAGAPIQVSVPPGTMGNAEIRVTTPIGSTTVAGGLTYAARSDFALPTSASPFQMILDKPRGRLIWSDTVANQLVVYSTASNSIVQTVPITGQPAGLSLTPDGTKLLVVNYSAKMLDVFDAASLTLLQQATPPAGTIFPTLTNPIFIVAVAGNKAFLLQSFQGSSDVSVYEYDIASNSFTLRSDIVADTYSVGAASADGSTAFVATSIWTAATDEFLPAHNAESFCTTAYNFCGYSLSADGAAIADGMVIFAQDGTLNNNIVGFVPGITDGFVPGQKLNATGSLDYLPETDRIRIADVRHGNILKTLMIPDGLSNAAFDGVAVDPDGQVLYVLTNTGVTTFTFAADPLSIGEVQVSGGQLTLLGSGFASGMTLQIDGSAVPDTVVDSQHLTATLPALSSAAHSITATLPSGASYSLDNALDPLPRATAGVRRAAGRARETAQNSIARPASTASSTFETSLSRRRRPADWIPAEARKPAGLHP